MYRKYNSGILIIKNKFT